jgi:hypothetical protein
MEQSISFRIFLRTLVCDTTLHGYFGTAFAYK